MPSISFSTLNDSCVQKIDYWFLPLLCFVQQPLRFVCETWVSCSSRSCLKMRTNHLTVWNGISALLLKTFADELTPAWCPLFQLSLDTGIIPIIWKKAVVIPVPKNNSSREKIMTLGQCVTSIVIKSLERIVTEKLRENVLHNIRSLSIAYKENRSTEDAIEFYDALIF